MDAGFVPDYTVRVRTAVAASSPSSSLAYSPSPAGQQRYLELLAAGRREETVAVDVMASEEYLSLAGGTAGDFVERVYETSLGRAATNAERQRWLGQLDAGASRRVVAAGVFLGRERVRVDVASTYSRLLRREPDTTGRRYWVRCIRAGDGVADMEAGFTASAEYGLALPDPPPD